MSQSELLVRSCLDFESKHCSHFTAGLHKTLVLEYLTPFPSRRHVPYTGRKIFKQIIYFFPCKCRKVIQWKRCSIKQLHSGHSYACTPAAVSHGGHRCSRPGSTASTECRTPNPKGVRDGSTCIMQTDGSSASGIFTVAISN